MNVNFFDWLRNGVRQSVLLGVSDAIDQIGAPDDSEQLHPVMSEVLQIGEAPKKKRVSRGGARKRLGKSLKELEPTTAEATQR